MGSDTIMGEDTVAERRSSEWAFSPLDRVEHCAFLLTHVLRVDERPWLSGMPPEEMRMTLLDQCDALMQSVAAPLRAVGDTAGAVLKDGHVVAPPGFRQAFAQIREAGWHAATVSEAEGGIGLSPILGALIEEMISGANIALHMYFGFTGPAAKAIRAFGEPDLADRIIPELLSGAFTATMCLTEPHAGSDLSRIRTFARRRADGRWAVSGEKIFISAGDHDLADNIVHIVLARIEDEDGARPSGLEGLGVLLVPRTDLDTGNRNGVHVTGIEQKMGLHGNPTCTLVFEEAGGYLLAPGGGGRVAKMAAMFAMMNHARLSTASGALGVAATAAALADRYTRERRSGHAAGREATAGDQADPIILHPDVMRQVLSAWSFVEGARGLVAWAASLGADGESHPDPDVRATAAAMARLLTPITKAFVTDAAFAATDDCLQVHGGHGYIREVGVEQLLRDLRITRIYEGANGIQAHDLVMRQMGAARDATVAALLGEIGAFVDGLGGKEDFALIAEALGAALAKLTMAVELAEEYRAMDEAVLLACSADVLEMFGLVLVGWRTAVSALAASEHRADLFPHMRLVAEHWAARHLPTADGLLSRMQWAGRTAAARRNRDPISPDGRARRTDP